MLQSFSQPGTTYQKTALEYLNLENSVRGTLLQVVLGIGVLAAAVGAWSQFVGASEQLELTRDQFVSGEFTSATELLSKPELESRLGGLYTLQRLTRTAANERMRQDSMTAYQMLAAFVKARSPWPPLKSLDKDQKRRGVERYNPLEMESLKKRAPDVQLALEIVGARDKRLPRGETYGAFLTDTDFRGATLPNLDLSNADLRGAALDYSNSRFVRSDPRYAGWAYPNFSKADLRGASLRCAHLEGANFENAQLGIADLRDADLRRFPPRSPDQPSTQENANLLRANLKGALWNGLTQWPDDFDPAKDPALKKRLGLAEQDDELFARSVNGDGILLVKGGTVDWQERWDNDMALSNPIVKGGTVVGVFDGKTWNRLPSPRPSKVDLPALTCNDYGKYWPGSSDLKCDRPERACAKLPEMDPRQSQREGITG